MTLSMQASFLAEAHVGDVIECRTQVDRVTRAVVFVSGRFSVGGADVATATSLWKKLARADGGCGLCGWTMPAREALLRPNRLQKSQGRSQKWRSTTTC